MSKEPRQALQSRERNHAPISWSFKVDMGPKHLAQQQAAVTKMTHQPIQRICRNSVETWIMRFLIAEIMWLCLVKRTGATKVRLYSFLTSRPVMTVRPPRRAIALRRFEANGAQDLCTACALCQCVMTFNLPGSPIAFRNAAQACVHSGNTVNGRVVLTTTMNEEKLKGYHQNFSGQWTIVFTSIG